jgi:hypothetical protein
LSRSRRRVFILLNVAKPHSEYRSPVVFPSRVLELEYAATSFGQPCPLDNRAHQSSVANPVPFCRKLTWAGCNPRLPNDFPGAYRDGSDMRSLHLLKGHRQSLRKRPALSEFIGLSLQWSILHVIRGGENRRRRRRRPIPQISDGRCAGERFSGRVQALKLFPTSEDVEIEAALALAMAGHTARATRWRKT